MNKERYEGLPDDLKAVIDANSGAALATTIGPLWDEAESVGMKLQEESGGAIVRIDAASKAKFDELSRGVEERWIAEMKKQGIDGEALTATAKAAVAEHSE